MTNQYLVTPLTLPKGVIVEWVDEAGYILSLGHQLFFSHDLKPPFQRLGAFNTSGYKATLSRLRPFQRLFRSMFYNVIKLETKRIFCNFGKSAGLLVDGEYVPCKGLQRPSRFLRGSCAVDANGGVYLGEYISNPERTPLRIYYLAPNSTQLEVVRELPEGYARHIHGIFRDPLDDSLWMTTGDFPEECRMSRTSDGFKTLETIGEGDETWRTVGLAFRDNAIYYGMDAEFRQNSIFRLDRTTLERRKLLDIDGPIYYAKTMANQVYLSLTAEGCPSQKVNQATLWAIDPDDNTEAIATFKKDLPPNQLMPGTINFAAGPGRAGQTYFHGIALKSADNVNFCITHRAQSNA
jgi:hypothetical protein